MDNALRELFKEEIAEEEKKVRQTLLGAINNLMTNMKWTAEQAMTAMNIPTEEWGFYKSML